MTKKNQEKFKKQDEQLESVNQTLTGAGKWIEDNSNMLTWCVIGIAAVVMAVILINQRVLQPKAQLAADENAKSIAYFMKGEYDKALTGDDKDDVFLGFEETAKQYSWFQEGKLAALYAGICYYEKGDYETAAQYLSKFSAKDLNIAPAAKQMLGDAYVELGEYGKAAKAFEAAAKSGNEIIAPMSLKKAGIAYLKAENKAKALKAFKTIKAKYPASVEAQDIDKYIAAAE